MTLRYLTATPDTMETVAYIHGLYPDGISNHGYIFACGHADPGPVRDRERILEDIRQAYYPHLPSRFACYFACESLEDARRFQLAGKRGDKKWENAIIWKAEAEKFFRADMNWLTPRFHLDAAGNAHRYWRQVAHPSPSWECLLTPPVTIMERVE